MTVGTHSAYLWKTCRPAILKESTRTLAVAPKWQAFRTTEIRRKSSPPGDRGDVRVDWRGRREYLPHAPHPGARTRPGGKPPRRGHSSFTASRQSAAHVRTAGIAARTYYDPGRPERGLSPLQLAWVTTGRQIADGHDQDHPAKDVRRRWVLRSDPWCYGLEGVVPPSPEPADDSVSGARQSISSYQTTVRAC
jgi:hypothetical protein